VCADSSPNPRNLLQAVPPLKGMLGFQVFNAVSFQIALGPPLVLLVRSWGASAVYIGAITSLVNWLALIQIFLAPHIEYIGYRRVMLSGWSARVAILTAIAALPFAAHWMSNSSLLIAMFICMFFFNLVRGFASASWLPWLTWLVPQRWRGRYISVEQMTINLTSAATFFGCGLVLGNHATNAQYGWLLSISCLAGWVSLFFMKGIPAPPPRPGKPLSEPFYRWVHRVWHDVPTRRLIRCNLVWIAANAAWGTFTIVFLRERLHMPDGFILRMSAIYTMGCVASAWGWGILADRFGSRPVLNLAIWVVLAAMGCWLVLALEIGKPDPALVVLVYLLLGVGQLGFGVANSRYLFNNAPTKFPVLAITLFSAATALGNALAPLVWGLFLKASGDVHWQFWGVSITNFTLFYLLSIYFLIGCKLMLPRLPEIGAAKTHVVVYHIMNDYPLRALHLVYGLLRPRNEPSETTTAAATTRDEVPVEPRPGEGPRT
jgi:MFS family permease